MDRRSDRGHVVAPAAAGLLLAGRRSDGHRQAGSTVDDLGFNVTEDESRPRTPRSRKGHGIPEKEEKAGQEEAAPAPEEDAATPRAPGEREDCYHAGGAEDDVRGAPGVPGALFPVLGGRGAVQEVADRGPDRLERVPAFGRRAGGIHPGHGGGGPARGPREHARDHRGDDAEE